MPRSPPRIENTRFVPQPFLIAKLMLFQRFPCDRYDEAGTLRREKRVLSVESKIIFNRFVIAVNFKIVCFSFFVKTTKTK